MDKKYKRLVKYLEKEWAEIEDENDLWMDLREECWKLMKEMKFIDDSCFVPAVSEEDLEASILEYAEKKADEINKNLSDDEQIYISQHNGGIYLCSVYARGDCNTIWEFYDCGEPNGLYESIEDDFLDEVEKVNWNNVKDIKSKLKKILEKIYWETLDDYAKDIVENAI